MVTSTAQRRAFARGVCPPAETVRPGIVSVPQAMPGLRLPYSLATIVHDDREAHLIDTGMPHEENIERIEAALAAVGLGLSEIASITLTHLHRDHAGLAGRLREVSGASVRMHEDDARAVREGAGRLDPAAFEVSLERWQVPAAEAAALRAHVAASPPEESAFPIDEVLYDGATLQLAGVQARVIHTPGHTAGHICLHLPTEGIVATGDHLLPAISTGVGLGGVWGDVDPLAAYLRSVERIGALGDLEVLPGHGYRFQGARARCDEVLVHHAARRERIAEVRGESPTAAAWEIAERLWRDRGWAGMDAGTRISALGQTGSHLAAIEAAAEL